MICFGAVAQHQRGVAQSLRERDLVAGAVHPGLVPDTVEHIKLEFRPPATLVRDARGAHELLGAAGQVARVIGERGVRVRAVSMPSWELFEAEPPEYRDSVLPPSVTARLAVEAARSIGWHRWVGPHGDILSVDRFGASAPGEEVFEHFGFTPDALAAKARGVVDRLRGKE